ncbi:MAG: 3-keto-L-gulonate-6-phosphate decarboxylase UlaD [Malacoplasma sp.]
MKPMLQIALDTLTVEEAIKNVEKVEKYIDVVEVGTILITSCGKSSIKELARAFPNKIIIADAKIADAGEVFAKMMFENNAQFTTCICAAEVPTIKKVYEVAKSFSQKNDVQIELTTNFTFEQAKEWRKINIEQVVYHRSRDSQAAGVSWTSKDLDNIKKLCDMGFKVTVTGGVAIEDIKFFKDLPIYIFIAGRSLRDAKDPLEAAKQFKDEFAKYWV